MFKKPLLISIVGLGMLTACSPKPAPVEPVTSLKAPSCLIATQTVKLVLTYKLPIVEPETLSTAQKTFPISVVNKSSYTYDSQGRIVLELIRYVNGATDSISYQYATSAVTMRTVNLSLTGRQEKTQTFALNQQGLAELRPLSYRATYNQDGYLLSLQGDHETATKIIDGNIVESIFSPSPSTPFYTIKTEFDLTKPGLPPVYLFQGYSSRNLPVRSTIDANERPLLIPNVYFREYKYTFDESGRVKRQILQGKDGVHRYEFGGDFVEVKDFTYKCL